MQLILNLPIPSRQSIETGGICFLFVADVVTNILCYMAFELPGGNNSVQLQQ
jgi:hypothetical protein